MSMADVYLNQNTDQNKSMADQYLDNPDTFNTTSSRTGSGSKEDPYTLTGEVDVPQEEGLGVSPVASQILGGATGKYAGKFVDDLLGKLPEHLLGKSQKYAGNKLNDIRENVYKSTESSGEAIDMLRSGKARAAEKLFAKSGNSLRKASKMKSGLDNPMPITVKALSKIPVVGKYMGTKYNKYIGEAVTDMLSPISGKAAMTSRYNLGQKIMKDSGMSEVDAVNFVEAIWKEREAILKASNVGSKLGTATGALLGTTVDD